MSARIRRIVLAPNTLTPLTFTSGGVPGAGFSQVSIGNGTPEILFVYSGDTPIEDVDNFLKIAVGYERLIRFSVRGSNDVIVYLKSEPGGEVVLIWG